ncbi:MAG: hypothetical protein A2Y82_04925 [Candidatus Buchananbacteria bacterium RBG_13_36_9]|uniref:Serine aminopeptidase S33 domain-containing protein n=1 Tax=Candidatus Buchananbacteria bacterium RBG_13_36_9 TaxID=1797530 RepID=A0A1G1XRS1_9BACT|nr:MAG: hypothetical protein A2Y82_04925 [Candidatus Buchananbacteria bacterium RBG_13_36_9]
MEKIIIKNRHNFKIVTLLEKAVQPKGLAIVLHGLGGFKEQDHIETFARVFKEAGYTVLRYDSTHTFGESEGKYEDATATNYYEDLEDVISWAKKQDWYIEPFVLVGHSMGGICSILYTQRHPNEVKALAPISTVVSGKLSIEAHGADYIREWKEKGYREDLSMSKPGVIKRLKYTEFEDRLKYDILPEADKLNLPILLIVGEKDGSTPPEHQKLLYKALPGPKELHIIKGAYHTFREKEHLAEIKLIFKNWINKL